MTGWRQRYSKKEAFNRIRRAFISGEVVTDDTQGAVPGELLSENQAVSDLAEILNNSLPTKTPTVPNAIRASVAEAETGTNDTKAVTPLGVAGAMGAIVSTLVEHGHVYCTGSAVEQALSTTWSKPTGVFTTNGLSSSSVTPDYTTDQIDVDLPGTYLVGLQVSFQGDGAYTLKGAAYIDDVRQEGIVFEETIGASGTSRSASAIGTVSVTGSNSELELYLLASGGTPNIRINTASLQVIGIPVI